MAVDEQLTSDPGGLFQRLQSRYGLGQDPLAMDVPFYPGGQREYSLETLRHLAAFGDMAILVTGARGAGKTRVLAELVRHESDRLDFQRLSTTDLASEQALADRLLAIAHQGLATGRTVRDAIYNFFKWSEKATLRGRRIVLLVDDADHMAAPLLRMLVAAFTHADRGQAAVPVLSGSDTLLDMLDSEGGGLQHQAHQIHLRPLNRDEIADYLRPRIAKAGGDPDVLLAASHLKKLHELGQGSFGRLKRTAPAVWLDMAGHQPAARRNRMSPRKLVIPLAVLLLLGGSWLMVSWQYDDVVAHQSDQPAPVERKTIRLGPDEESWHPEAETTSSPQRSAPDVSLNDPISASEAKANEVPTDAPAGDGAHDQSPVAGDEALAADEPKADEVAAADSVAAIAQPSEAESKEVPQPTPADQANVVAEPEAAPAETSNENNQPQPNASTAQADTEAAVSADQTADETPGRAFKPQAPDRFTPVEALRAGAGLTAQFIAGYEEKTALDFLSEHPDIEGMVYTRSTRKGKPWYVVVYGQFSSRNEARQAVSDLPQGLAEHDVWIRSQSGL